MAALIADQELATKVAAIDARDKLLRQQMTKQNQLDKSRTYVGTCDDMCPERERYLRLGFHLSIFERDANNQPNENAMVKEYRRAGADQEEPLPHELRTPKALETTMNYLVCKVMNDPRSKSHEFALEWYDFLWDRLRAIRKDITQQDICDRPSAMLVERCARFHVHSCYAMNNVKDFDVDMNKRNLNDCLQMLRQMYNDLKTAGISCSGELEFQKYDILLHLDEDHLSTNVLLKTSDHRQSPEMKFVTQIFNSYASNEYYTFFKLTKKADYMTSCILSLYANKARLKGFKIIVAGCSSRQTIWYPAHSMCEALGFDDLDDLREFVSIFDVEIQEKESKHYVLLYKDLLNVIRQFNLSSLPQFRSRCLVEDKAQGTTVGYLVYGGDVIEPEAMEIQEEDDSNKAPTRRKVFEDNSMDIEEDMRHIRQSNFIAEIQDETQIVTQDISEINDLPTHEEQYITEPVEKIRRLSQSFVPRDQQITPTRKEFETLDTSNKTSDVSSIINSSPNLIITPPEIVTSPFNSASELEVGIELSPIKTPQSFIRPTKLPDIVDVETEKSVKIPEPKVVVKVQPSLEQESRERELAAKRERLFMMPAGRFKRLLLSSKAPTLHRTPSHSNDDHRNNSPPRKKVQNDKTKESIESITEALEDEVKANQSLFQLIRMFI